MTIDEFKDLSHHFIILDDPRMVNKNAHKLSDIIVISILAVICGAEHWTSIEMFGKSKLKWLKTFLDLPGGVPSHDTFGRVFRLLDAEVFSQCFINWITTLNDLTKTKHIAIDGKAIRGSVDKSFSKSAIHMVSAWAKR